MADEVQQRARLIAVAIGPRTMTEAEDALRRAAAEADLAEIRLDAFAEPFDLPGLLRARACPLVMTLRPTDQGGRSELSAAQRFRILLRAAELGAEYVDLEWDAATAERLAALAATGARVLVSRDDFRTMPDLPAWWDDLAARGAPIVKVVGMARDPRDCLSVFAALRRATRPTVAIAMGGAGLPSRVLALREPACFLTYGTLSGDAGTAPGQVSAAELRTDYHARRLGPGTAVYGLLDGHGETDRAREYNAWFAAQGLDAVAIPVPADSDAPGIVDAYRVLPVSGWHLHGQALQETVGQALDELAPTACRRGKVNAIVARDGRLIGAWVESPAEQFALWTGLAASTGG